MSAASYRATGKLRSGIAVTIRAIRPDDGPRLLAAYRSLSPDSIYTRFFHHRGDLSEREVRSAIEVDFVKEVALVATVERDSEEIIAGGARYHLLDLPAPARCAEIAFLVVEGFRGQGLAGHLLSHLAGCALAADITTLEAEVLPQNHAMLSVFERSGFPVRKKRDGGILHLTLTLAPPPSP